MDQEERDAMEMTREELTARVARGKPARVARKMPFRFRRRIWWAKLLGRNIWAFNTFDNGEMSKGIWWDNSSSSVFTDCTITDSGRGGIRFKPKKWLILP